jgi:general secretion pathway protein G
MCGRKRKSARPGCSGPNRAFSLVELVVVVVIIAIIAAIALPRFSRATASATEAYLNSSISTVRRAIEMYYAEHDRYPGYAPASGTPDDAMFVKQLTEYSDYKGHTQTASGSPFIYGPYLRPPFPENPFNKLSTVKVLADPSGAVAAGSTGWVAVLSNGDFRINASQAEFDEHGVSELLGKGAGEVGIDTL